MNCLNQTSKSLLMKNVETNGRNKKIAKFSPSLRVLLALNLQFNLLPLATKEYVLN